MPIHDFRRRRKNQLAESDSERSSKNHTTPSKLKTLGFFQRGKAFLTCTHDTQVVFLIALENRIHMASHSNSMCRQPDLHHSAPRKMIACGSNSALRRFISPCAFQHFSSYRYLCAENPLLEEGMFVLRPFRRPQDVALRRQDSCRL